MTRAEERYRPPEGLLSLAEWDDLGEDTPGAELVDGVVVVSPSPGGPHQLLMLRLGAAVDDAVRPDYRVLPDRDLVVDPGDPPTVRRPDLTVVRRASALATRVDPGDVTAVVEILSPGTRRTDRVAKRAEYAELGVDRYLLVEPGPPVVVTELALRDGAYVEVAVHTDRLDVEIAGQRVEIDLDAVL